MTLGQRIQELRKQAGLSQEGLGEQLGVSRQAVSKWEGDNGIPELDTLIAMSRLFGVTIGQLLGVEEPASPEETDPEPDEERVEAILRRYVEESRRQEPAGRSNLGAWIIAGCAAVLSVIVLIVAVNQVRQVRGSVNTLHSHVVEVEDIVTNVRNQVGGLSEELRGVLEEQNNLHSTFAHEVVAFDVPAQTVDVRLSVTLKEYIRGSTAQFVLNWIKVDGTKGELLCDPVPGPQFETVVTIPMNYHLEIGVRVLQEDGTILEQTLDTVYSGMHPGEFRVQYRSGGTATYNNAEGAHVTLEGELRSSWPELIYPVKVEILVMANGEEFLRREEAIEDHGDGTYTYCQSVEMVIPKEVGENYEIWHIVTDNYGQEETMRIR